MIAWKFLYIDLHKAKYTKNPSECMTLYLMNLMEVLFGFNLSMTATRAALVTDYSSDILTDTKKLARSVNITSPPPPAFSFSKLNQRRKSPA